MKQEKEKLVKGVIVDKKEIITLLDTTPILERYQFIDHTKINKELEKEINKDYQKETKKYTEKETDDRIKNKETNKNEVKNIEIKENNIENDSVKNKVNQEITKSETNKSRCETKCKINEEFILNNKKIETIKQLIEFIESNNINITNHLEKEPNDFYFWILNSVGEKDIANRIKNVKTKNEFLETLKKICLFK